MFRRLLTLHDLTTSPHDPPQFRALERERNNVGRDMTYPVHFAEIQKKNYPHLMPLSSDLVAAQVFELVQAAALEMERWEIAAVEADRLQLEAIAESWIPWLKEDIVIQVRSEKEGSSVHMRCKARVSQRLIGSQADRIAEFFKRLQNKLV